MKNGPKLWTKLLNEAPKGSVLMGGAVVDFNYGHEAIDYDIFHEYKVGMPIVPVNWKFIEGNYNEEYKQGLKADGNHAIGSVYNYIVDGEHTVQLVGVHYHDPIHHFYNFDHSLTLGRFTKSGMFIHAEVFRAMQTHEVRYLSKNKNPEAIAKSLARARKKTTRYSGGHEGHWTFKGFQGEFKVKEGLLD